MLFCFYYYHVPSIPLCFHTLIRKHCKNEYLCFPPAKIFRIIFCFTCLTLHVPVVTLVVTIAFVQSHLPKLYILYDSHQSHFQTKQLSVGQHGKIRQPGWTHGEIQLSLNEIFQHVPVVSQWKRSYTTFRTRCNHASLSPICTSSIAHFTCSMGLWGCQSAVTTKLTLFQPLLLSQN